MATSLKVQAIAAVVRLVADNTNLIRKPDGIETLFGGLFAPQESYDIRIAKNVDAEAERIMKAMKQRTVDRKFKKITQNY